MEYFLTTEEISKKLNLSAGTIRYRARKLNIKQDNKNIYKFTKEEFEEIKNYGYNIYESKINRP